MQINFFSPNQTDLFTPINSLFVPSISFESKKILFDVIELFFLKIAEVFEIYLNYKNINPFFTACIAKK